MKVIRRAAEALPKWEIEKRVRTIEDPVKKLRYLRREQELSHTKWRPPAWCRHAVAATLGIALLLIPRPTASDVDQALKPGQVAASSHRSSDVWLVERKEGIELYSNGLQIETRHRVPGEKRPYPIYDRETLGLVEWGSSPVGIVYHTSESHIAPFDADHNQRLRLVGQWLLDHVRMNRSYHYVIDRFGRVHSVVDETGVANHAGYSVWADDRRVYVNLNPSFLGVSFESRMPLDGQGAEVTSAQLHAARVLTQMLRSKYRIPASRCVTHAQVSVALPNMQIGNHTDWSAGFPFGALGLGDNYGLPVAAISVFGFAYDSKYLRLAGSELWRGVALGEDSFRHRAALKRVSVTQHREAVQKRYREIIKGIDRVVEAVEKSI
jgi:hypothetical protein